jgi:hypothetical protein
VSRRRPIVAKNRSAKKRYSIYYYRFADESLVKQDTSGSTAILENAYGRAADHVARSELNQREYAMALIIDRHKGELVRSYTKRASSIQIKEY